MLRPGFEPGISDSKGVAPLDTPASNPCSRIPILIIINNNLMNWDKYKEYLYTNLRPNTARLALKYGKFYYYVIERMDIKDLLVLQPAKQRHILKGSCKSCEV